MFTHITCYMPNKQKIQSKQDLQEFLKCERQLYCDYMARCGRRYWWLWLTGDSFLKTMQWQCASRRADYHSFMFASTRSLWHLLCKFWCDRRRNRLGLKLGLDIRTENIGKGLLIYHGNNVINYGCVIGENLRLHGSVTIGNSGRDGSLVPIIGDNVKVGAGACLIGGITIADGVTIGAGAVVVHSMTEPGMTVAGVPAKKL